MSTKLILKFKDTVISEFELDQEETTIGRKPENTIHIDNLAVSSKHARVLKIGKKVILEDLGSTNGTLVNGQETSKHILNNGDVITVGKHTLTFVALENESPVAAPVEEDDMDKTMIISSAAREEMMTQGGASARPSIASPMVLAKVQYISGPLMGKVVELKSSLTSIGKGDGCKIKVKGLLVGKQAAVITRRPTGYHITYLEGISKLKVNGEVVGSSPRVLKDGDIIELSDTKLEFFIKK
ncbi:FHA domain-containing protein [Ghiorsea bivora]|uniref:FHA domain-containing protein n=1 Tax=Ghiorsea bivora TaxID=1485545 RepID=UPI00056DB43C|nr:FHA domain-containing protein [Ghiorsea bivora]